jgi:cysteinyl-tRNA synthetase
MNEVTSREHAGIPESAPEGTAIVLYNSLTRKKEPLQPRVPGQIGMYVCGMTVYDFCHIGHARVMIVFDTVVRYLRASGLQVRYVRNFTDIDDKIIRRAAETGVPIAELTQRYIDAFHEDMRALHVLPADIEPRATGHIAAMQELIRGLIDNGVAYVQDGDVYFAVERAPRYGRLSGKPLDELISGARIAVREHKESPLDFVLWKAAKPGEPYWPSPWGDGRPGWHIECSAMSRCYLGEQFDIHGGGLDLIFPHHENEIAQSEGVSTDHPWVRYWMHNGFVNVVNASGQREKMSKSLGNFMTIRDILARYPGEVVRMFVLNSHYRSPLDFSYALLDTARAGMDRLYESLRSAQRLLETPMSPLPAVSVAETGLDGVWSTDPTHQDDCARLASAFFAAMNDDFNTAQALAALFDGIRQLNVAVTAGDRARTTAYAALIRRLGAVLGLAGSTPEAWFQRAGQPGGEDASALTHEQIDQLVAQRLQARKDRDFAEADRIRKELAGHGIVLQDRRDETTWSYGETS